MPPLVPCPSCQRHVRSTEEACPFCKSKTGGRAAAGFLAATLGAALATGCPSGPPPNRAVAEYGAPPPPQPTATPNPAATPAQTPDMSVAPPDPDDMRGAAEYGAPPPRATPIPDDRERAVPKYGAPPPRRPR